MRYISILLTAFVILACSFSLSAQVAFEPGKILRRATGGGDVILNPNGNDWISISNTGFVAKGDDTTSSVSEIHYRALMPFGGEPCCDLRRGPDHRFSDFVPDNNNNGVYINFVNSGVDATSYLRIRMRMGTIIPGSKGFSLLIDTDSSYGNTGTRPDANYVAKTTGINGNPGFEIEVVLETGFRVAIYNVDGKGNPSDGIDSKVMTGNEHLIFYDNSWLSRSQVSFAATSEGGDPDYFIDWYVTLAELKLMKPSALGSSYINNAFQWLRIIPTTVMAPKPSTAGPVSDIYGSEVNTTIENQPKIKLATNEVSGICTAAPVITSVSTSGSNNITGSWTKGSYGGSSATIYLYLNGDTTSVLTTTPATINVNSGGTWQATVAGLTAGQTITAKAKGSSLYESRFCYTSNSVTAGSCDTRPWPLNPTMTVTTGKGISGTGYGDNTNGLGSGSNNGTNSGIWKIQLNKVATTGFTVMGTDEYPRSFPNKLGNPNLATHYNLGTVTGTWEYSGGSSGGPNDASVTIGQYANYTVTSAGCKSGVVFYCHAGSGNTDVPTLTSDAGSVYTTTTTISGAITPVANYPSAVRIYLDSVYQGTATVTNPGLATATWSYTFAQSLTAGKKVWIRAQRADNAALRYCESQLEKIVITACTNTAPVFNVDTLETGGNKFISDTTVLSGIGTAGGTVQIKKAGTTVMTTTVGTDGTWSARNSGTTYASTYTGYSKTGESYTASLTTTGCATAATSASVAVATQTPVAYCLSSISFSVDASTGGTYTEVASGGTPNGVPITSDAKWIKGTIGAAAAASLNTKTVKLYVNGGLIGRQTVPSSSATFPDIYVGGMLTQGDILTLAVTENDGTSAEFLCASMQIACDCISTNKPTAPAVNSAASTLTVVGGGTAIIKLTSPQNDNFISVKNKYTGRALSRGGTYTGGNVTISARLFGPGETLTLEASPVDSSQTATIVAQRLGGTETCYRETDVPLVVNNLLPVVLSEFKGYRNDKSNVLSWRTETEINFSHFEIERSANGIQFDKIGTKAGTGFLSGPNYYSYSDNTPLDGNNFYRLKMVDVDGKAEYSNVIALKNSGSSVVINSVRPNPFVTEIKISAVFMERSDVRILLADASGRTLRTQSFAGIAGLNEIKMGDLGSLPSGTYFISVIAGSETFRYKVLKINSN